MKTQDLLVLVAVAVGGFVLVNRARAQAALNGMVRTPSGGYVAAPQSSQAKQAWVDASVLWVLNNAKPFYDPKTGTTTSTRQPVQSAPVYGPQGDYSASDYAASADAYAGFQGWVET